MVPEYFRLPVLGFAVGALGTLIGVGGGFLLMPVLLLLHPGAPPRELAAVSLAVVFLNAASGSLAYAQARRIDYRSGVLFGACTLPGAVLGATATGRVPRAAFDSVFGVLLIALAAFLVFRPAPAGQAARGAGRGRVARTLIDREGATHEYSFPLLPGLLASFAVGLLSSFLGIGGGIIHVPLMTLLGFPVHVATATSQLVLAATALAGTVTNAAAGALAGWWLRAATLGAGAVAGAQLGAFLSKKVRAVWILRVLAAALASVGVRVLLSGLRPPQ